METVELDALLRTHVGSTREAGTDATTNEANGTADDQKKQDAMNKSDEYWKPGRTCQNMEPGLKQQRRMNRDYSEDVLKPLKKKLPVHRKEENRTASCKRRLLRAVRKAREFPEKCFTDG